MVSLPEKAKQRRYYNDVESPSATPLLHSRASSFLTLMNQPPSSALSVISDETLPSTPQRIPQPPRPVFVRNISSSSSVWSTSSGSTACPTPQLELEIATSEEKVRHQLTLSMLSLLT
jgi:hypothetical protein